MTDRYEKIRRALAMGPTPGPWCVLDANTAPYITARLPENEGHRWDDPTICNLYEDVTPCDSVTFGPWLEAMPNAQANGSFITACDPDTIAALLAERDALRAEVADLQRERAVLLDKLNGTPCAEVRWQQERDELAKEAARYRALKEMAALSDMPGYAEIVYSIVIPTGVDQASHVFRGDPLPDLDAAIDAAREGEKCTQT